MTDMLYRLVQPVLMRLDAEDAHALALKALRAGVAGHHRYDASALHTRVFGRDFINPLGLAAGFDKNAEALHSLLNLGFGFIEAGTVTPRPQLGNPRPRVFRDAKTQTVVNRMGFPGLGMQAVAQNLSAFRARHQGMVGINIGINKDEPDPVAAYVSCIDIFTQPAAQADYIVINVSSPNTPGLRGLQVEEKLTPLLQAAVKACPHDMPLLVKIAPDLSEGELEGVAAAVLAAGVSGVIISNTTLSRPQDIPATLAAQAGGLSGAPLRSLALRALGQMYGFLGGKCPLIGVGGIIDAQDAYARICAGASLVQIYAALVFHGPSVVVRILEGLNAHLQRDGFSCVADAVGSTAKEPLETLRRMG